MHEPTLGHSTCDGTKLCSVLVNQSITAARAALFALLSLGTITCQGAGVGRSDLTFEISFPAATEAQPLDGQVLLLLSTRDDQEPRFHAASWGPQTQPFFGIEVEQLAPGQPAVIDDAVLGYPVSSIADLPAREYNVQAVLNVYTTFHRADGHVVKLHMDQWEGQHWNVSPGNLYSDVQQVTIDPQRGGTVRIELTNKIPPIEPPEDTRYVKHVKIKSELVSEFWGTDMYIGAVVLLPPGFESYPDARYPVAYSQGHFAPTFRWFREQPPDPAATGRASASQASAYDFYRKWTSGQLPKMLIVMPQDPTPYYDDSYAVNSANVGPYGDAITQELIPYVEQQFRGIGEGWARTLFGGSTGGWRALAVQIFYPDLFNGTWSFCPDPVDFRYFQLVNIYEDDNAYYPNSEWKRHPIRPVMRDVDDQVLMTYKDASTVELVLGTRGRSGGQLDIFQAVYGPVAEDGYTRLLYDKRTGMIDKGVVDYWRENYDLRHILERDWETLGPRLRGKIHIYMGDMDTFVLEEAVRLMEQFLEGTRDPYYAGSVEWGERQPHCYTGAPPGQSSVEFVLPQMARHIAQTAPAGADVRSWRY